jgi:MMPL family
MLFFKRFGVRLATAVLLDATIVRAVLLPATMKLLGDWNWYLPKWLQWLPRGEGDTSEPPPDVAPAPIAAQVPAHPRRREPPLWPLFARRRHRFCRASKQVWGRQWGCLGREQQGLRRRVGA